MYLGFASHFQCDGIPIGKTSTFSTNQLRCMRSIIISKFSSTVHSSHFPLNLHLFLSLLWLFAQMLRDCVVILLTFNNKERLFFDLLEFTVLIKDYQQMDCGCNGGEEACFSWSRETHLKLRTRCRFYSLSCSGNFTVDRKLHGGPGVPILIDLVPTNIT